MASKSYRGSKRQHVEEEDGFDDPNPFPGQRYRESRTRPDRLSEAGSSTASFHTGQQNQEWLRMQDFAGEGSGARAAGRTANTGLGADGRALPGPDGGATGGAGGMPIPVSFSQGQRKVDRFTCKFAGTTWVVAANSGTGGNLGDNIWSNFPWEFSRMFLGPDTIRELNAKYMYWKGEAIQISFKNPLCVQNLGTTASGLVQSGMNNQAMLYMYKDDCYLTGVNGKPGPGGSVYSISTMNSLMDSWRHHGYLGNVPFSLPNKDIDTDHFVGSIPDAVQIGMGNGAEMSTGWNIDSPYWRSTSEFFNSRVEGLLDSDVYFGFSRWDEQCGTIGELMIPTSTSTMTYDYADPQKFFTRAHYDKQAQRSVINPATMNGFPTRQLYFSPDPIPKLWLQLQPQISSLETGTAQSRCQLEWEMSVQLACTGRVPRKLGNVQLQDPSAPTDFGTVIDHVNTLPIFAPIGSSLDYGTI